MTMDERKQTLFAKFAGQWCDDCRVAHPNNIRLCFGCGGPLRPCEVTVDAADTGGKPTKPGDPAALRPIHLGNAKTIFETPGPFLATGPIGDE